MIASYSTMVEHEGKVLLFYNDCKHWVLFKHVPERLLQFTERAGTDKEDNE